MFCKHCGAQNNDNAKFCAVCGAKTEIGSSIGEMTNNTIAYNQEAGNVENDKKQSKLGKIVNGIISFIAASYLLGSLVGLFEKSPIPFLVFIGIEFLLEIIKHKFPKIPEPLIFAVEIIILIICINSANAAGVVNSVKKGSPKNNPNVTYEEAFDNFFANPEWKSAGKDDEGNKLVKFTGNCTYFDEYSSAVVTFTVYDETFTVSSIKMNGQELGAILTNALIGCVFDEYDQSY